MPVVAPLAAVDGEYHQEDEDKCAEDDADDGSRAEGVVVIVIAAGGEGWVACKVAAVVLTVLKVTVGVVPHMLVVSH